MDSALSEGLSTSPTRIHTAGKGHHHQIDVSKASWTMLISQLTPRAKDRTIALCTETRPYSRSAISSNPAQTCYHSSSQADMPPSRFLENTQSITCWALFYGLRASRGTCHLQNCLFFTKGDMDMFFSSKGVQKYPISTISGRA